VAAEAVDAAGTAAVVAVVAEVEVVDAAGTAVVVAEAAAAVEAVGVATGSYQSKFLVRKAGMGLSPCPFFISGPLSIKTSCFFLQLTCRLAAANQSACG
jgi:hypothetical protein